MTGNANEIEKKVAEMYEKQRAAGLYGDGAGQVGKNSTMGCDMLQPARPCLRERVRDGLQRAQREQRKAMRLAELDHLLEKHPDIASILDLMEEVR